MPTNFNEIIFDPAHHSYTYHGQPLTSVSKTISQLKPPFDREGVAAKSAVKKGQTVAEVLAGWDRSRDASMARGTRVHEYIAQKLTDRSPVQDDMFLALNQRLPEMDAFEKFWAEQPGAVYPVAQVEWVIGDVELGIAGTVDAVLTTPRQQAMHIFDWKTGKEFKTENRFQRLLDPFSDLDDCDLSNYSLQLSLYRLIIERNADDDLHDSYIVHLTSEGEYIIHRAIDLRGRLLEWLTERNA